jgi:hypothetical protein
VLFFPSDCVTGEFDPLAMHSAEAAAGLGRIVALYHRSSTSYHVH